MKLYQKLEKIFGRRITSDEEIPRYLNGLTQLGKFDEPKKLAVLIELCQRISALEEEIKKLNDPQQRTSQDVGSDWMLVTNTAAADLTTGFSGYSVEAATTTSTFPPLPDDAVIESNPLVPPDTVLVVDTNKFETKMSWNELRTKGKELGIYKFGQTKAELQELIASKVL